MSDNNKVTVDKELVKWVKILRSLVQGAIEQHADSEDEEVLAWIYRNETKDAFNGCASMFYELKVIKAGLDKCYSHVPDEFK